MVRDVLLERSVLDVTPEEVDICVNVHTLNAMWIKADNYVSLAPKLVSGVSGAIS